MKPIFLASHLWHTVTQAILPLQRIKPGWLQPLTLWSRNPSILKYSLTAAYQNLHLRQFARSSGLHIVMSLITGSPLSFQGPMIDPTLVLNLIFRVPKTPQLILLKTL